MSRVACKGISKLWFPGQIRTRMLRPKTRPKLKARTRLSHRLLLRPRRLRSHRHPRLRILSSTRASVNHSVPPCHAYGAQRQVLRQRQRDKRPRAYQAQRRAMVVALAPRRAASAKAACSQTIRLQARPGMLPMPNASERVVTRDVRGLLVVFEYRAWLYVALRHVCDDSHADGSAGQLWEQGYRKGTGQVQTRGRPVVVCNVSI